MRGTHSSLTVTTMSDPQSGATLPLFHFPIQICKATGSDDPSFNRATPHGSDYDTVYRDKVTGEIYEYGDLIRGVRVGDSFAEIKPDQIEAIEAKVSMTDTRVLRALRLGDVEMDRATGRYYLQAPPQGGGHTHYKLLYEALLRVPRRGKAKERPAMALEVKFTSRSRQKLGVIFADPERGCLTLVQLCFAAEVREPDEAVLAPQGSKVKEAEVELARQVIDGLVVEAEDFEEPVDEVVPLKRSLIEAAAAGEKIEAPVIPEATVVAADADLSDVLTESLSAA